MKFFEWLFHEHKYVKIGFKQIYGATQRYSMRHYKCKECGKEKWVDGRFDRIGG